MKPETKAEAPTPEKQSGTEMIGGTRETATASKTGGDSAVTPSKPPVSFCHHLTHVYVVIFAKYYPCNLMKIIPCARIVKKRNFLSVAFQNGIILECQGLSFVERLCPDGRCACLSFLL